MVRRRLDRCCAIGRLLHAQRLQQFLFEHRIPIRCARRLGDNTACQNVSDVRVGEGGAEARDRLDVAQGSDQSVPVKPQYTQRIIGVGRQAGTLREQIVYTEFTRDPWVPELKAWIEVHHTVVPVELAAIDHHGNRRSEERLRGRADLEHRLWLDQLPAGPAAHAEAFGVNKPVVGNNADGEAWRIERLHAIGDVGLDVLNRCLDTYLDRLIWLRGGRCDKRDRHHQRDQDCYREMPCAQCSRQVCPRGIPAMSQ